VLQKWVGLWVALQLFLFCEGLACVLIFWTVGLGWYCRSVRVADNGLGLCEVGAFKAQMFNLAQMFIRITNA